MYARKNTGCSIMIVESFCLLLLKYGYKWLLKPTGGSPVMVHLIKYVSKFFVCHLRPLPGVSLNK